MLAGEALSVRAPTGNRLTLGIGGGPAILRLDGSATGGAITWVAGVRALETYVVPRVVAAGGGRLGGGRGIVAGLPVCVTGDESDVRWRIGRLFAAAAELPERRAILDPHGAAIARTRVRL
jgi:hypothetical protein